MYNSNNIKLFGGATLTGLAQGFCSEAPLLGQFIAPVVTVTCRTGAVIRFGKEAFATQDTRRAYSAKVATVSSKLTAVTYTLESNALAYEIPLEILEEAGCLTAINQDAIDLRQIETNNIIARLNRGHELNVVSLVTAPATYESANYAASITAGVPGPNLAWTDVASTPIRDVLTLQSLVRKSVGCRFNSIVLGSNIYDILLTHPDIVGRLQYNTTDGVNEAVLARYFNVAAVFVADAVGLNDAGNLSSLFPEDGFLGFYSPAPNQKAVSLSATNGVSKATPSSFYTYMHKNGFVVSPEKFYDITSNGSTANVVRAVVSAEYEVKAVSLGATDKVNSAIYIANCTL